MALLADTVQLQEDRERLGVLGRRRRDLLGAAALLAGGGVVFAVAGRADVGAAALIAAAVGVAAAGLASSERAQVLTRLVASGFANDIAEVREFAHALTSPRRRRRLARGLELAVRAGRPGLHHYTYVRPERAQQACPQLAELAAAFRDPSRAVTPTSAALCRRLLCEATVSPLYNSAVPEQELTRALQAIAAGFGTRGSPKDAGRSGVTAL